MLFLEQIRLSERILDDLRLCASFRSYSVFTGPEPGFLLVLCEEKWYDLMRSFGKAYPVVVVWTN